jgi:hypothetical protein
MFILTYLPGYIPRLRKLIEPGKEVLIDVFVLIYVDITKKNAGRGGGTPGVLRRATG